MIEGPLGVPGNMGKYEIYQGDKGTWSKLKGNKGTPGNSGQVKSSLSFRLTINLKNNPKKLQGTRGFSEGNSGKCDTL